MRGRLLLIAFQAGEALVMDFRDANEGSDVLAVLLLTLGDFGESLSEFPVVVDVHGGYQFKGMIDGLKPLFEGGAFWICVVWHGEAASPVSIIA
jgi:hypothetical protein